MKIHAIDLHELDKKFIEYGFLNTQFFKKAHHDEYGEYFTVWIVWGGYKMKRIISDAELSDISSVDIIYDSIARKFHETFPRASK
jgi:hypothetical protein